MLTIGLGILALIAWVGLEFTFRKGGEASSLSGSPTDRYSTPLLVLGYLCAIVLPFVLGSGPAGEWFAWLGVVIAAAGLAIRAWSMSTLGSA